MSLEHSPARSNGAVAGSPMPPDADYWHALINEKLAAEFLGVTDRTMQNLRQRGGGPKYTVISSRCIRYTRLGCRTWAEERLRTSTADPGPEAAP